MGFPVLGVVPNDLPCTGCAVPGCVGRIAGVVVSVFAVAQLGR